MECRHCGKILEEPKLSISVETGSSTSYFYYPSISCKTKDGEIKMLMKKLDELNNEGKDYILDIDEKTSDALKQKGVTK